jgi:hypothetical protein
MGHYYCSPSKVKDALKLFFTIFLHRHLKQVGGTESENPFSGKNLTPCALQTELLHDMFCSKLDGRGETSRKPLTDCLSSLFAELRENHVILWVRVL